MKATYRRPTGNKKPGHDSPEVEQAIAEVEQAAAATAAASCPFCGGQPEVRLCWLYKSNKEGLFPDIAVRCSECKIGTRTFPVGTMITGRMYTVADRVQQAAAQWNRRQDGNKED